MKVVVTGASGNVGTSVLSALADTRRAHEELGWEPRAASLDALAELLNGLRRGSDGETPPLRRAS